MDSARKRQWLWFAGLAVGGLAAVTSLAYGIKILLRLI